MIPLPLLLNPILPLTGGYYRDVPSENQGGFIGASALGTYTHQNYYPHTPGS